MSALRWCFKYIFVYIFLIACMTLLDIGTKFIMKNIVNELQASAALVTFTSALVGLILMYMLGRVSGFMGAFGNNFYHLNVDKFFRKIIMWKVYKTPQERFFDTEFNEKYTFAGGAVSRISDYIRVWVNLIFSSVGSLAATVAIFAVYEPWLILNAVVVSAVTAAVYVHVSKKQYKLDKRQVKDQRVSDYYRSLLTSKEGAKELQIYKIRDHFYKKWLEKYSTLRDERIALELEKDKLNNVLIMTRFLLRIITTALLTVGVYYNRYDVGTFVMLFGLIESFSSQVYGLVTSLVSGAYKEVKYLCDYYDFIMPVTKAEIKEIVSGDSEEDDGLPYGKFETLRAEHVSYSYPNSDKKAVDDLTFSLKKGEIVSILVYNGSGKQRCPSCLTEA